MPSKDEKQPSNHRSKNPQGLSLTAQKQLNLEIATFLDFLNTLPNSTQIQIIPFVKKLYKEYEDNKKLKDFLRLKERYVNGTQNSFSKSKNVLMMCTKLFELHILQSKIPKLEQDMLRQLNNNNQTLHHEFKNQDVTFNDINVIHPSFDQYFKMSRDYSDQGQQLAHLRGSESQFYTQPRLIVRLQERNNFKTGNQLRGNILLLTVDGNSISGRNGLAVIDRKSVQWWQKRDNSFISTIIEEQKANEQNPVQSKPVQAQQTQPSYQKLTLKYKITGHTGRITSISVSYDQLYLLTAGSDNLVKLWCLRSKMQLTEYKCHLKTIWSVNFCQSGYFFLTGSADCLIKMWKTDEPTAVRILSGHESDVFKVQFMRNPDFAISASNDATVKIWNLIEATCIKTFYFDHPIYHISLSFSGKYLAVNQSNGAINLFDFVKGKKLKKFMISVQKNKHQGEEEKKLLIHSMCFSDNDKQFACISKKYIFIYSTDTISEKSSGNIFQIYGDKQLNSNNEKVTPKQVINIGRDTNLFYCKYHPKNYLVIAGSNKKY